MRVWSAGRGFCPSCGLDCALGSINGAPAVLATHQRSRVGFGHPLKERCPGSGKSPRGMARKRKRASKEG